LYKPTPRAIESLPDFCAPLLENNNITMPLQTLVFDFMYKLREKGEMDQTTPIQLVVVPVALLCVNGVSMGSRLTAK
jgi:hypothetical protein